MSAFASIIGYENIKEELYRVCDTMKNPEKYNHFGVVTPRGVLFYGDPGVGKTMMAQALAKESGRKVFTIRKNMPDGEFVKFIKDSFENARKEDSAIVLLDDMDKFANDDSEHCDAEEYVTVQAEIDECKGREILVIATVNDIYCLPKSLLRAGRFDEQIEMKVPKGDDAIKIIEFYLKNKNVKTSVEPAKIARLIEGHSCAELEKVINEAGMYAAYEGKKTIDLDDVMKAVMKLIFEIPQNALKDSNSNMENIVIHEAGHVVVSEVLCPGSVTLAARGEKESSSGGITIYKINPNRVMQKEDIENEVIRSLAGKAAVEIMLGIEDIGCSADLEIAFNEVRKMVDNYCCKGFECFTDYYGGSRYILENKDRMTAYEIGRYYRQAKKILIDNKRFLKHVIKALTKTEVLIWEDLEIIKEHVGV